MGDKQEIRYGDVVHVLPLLDQDVLGADRPTGLVGHVIRRVGRSQGMYFFRVEFADKRAIIYSERELHLPRPPAAPRLVAPECSVEGWPILAWYGPDECTFHVERRSPRGKWKSLCIVAVKSYIDRSAVRGAANIYQVRSVNDAGESVPCPFVSIKVPAAGANTARIIRPRQRVVDVD